MRTLEQILRDKRAAERDVQAAQARVERFNQELADLRSEVLKAVA